MEALPEETEWIKWRLGCRVSAAHQVVLCGHDFILALLVAENRQLKMTQELGVSA